MWPSAAWVLDVQTGAVLAMSCQPDYDPNTPRRLIDDDTRAAVDALTGEERSAALQKAQYAMAQEAARLIDSYVPLDTGTLKNSVQTASKYDEGLLVYNTPYARKQYYLHAEGSDLRTFMGNKERGQEADKYKGLRGSYWGQRAIADVGEHLALFGAKAVTTFWGGMGHL